MRSVCGDYWRTYGPGWIFNNNLLIKFVQWRCSSLKVQKLKKKIAKIVKDGNFELGKEIKKDVFFLYCHERGTKKKNLASPWGMEPQIFGFRAPMLYHWATETPRQARSIICTKLIGHACVCKFSSHSWKTLSMSRSLIPEVRHTFYFLSFFISYLSGNKLGYLPQGIFKGLKQLLIL